MHSLTFTDSSANSSAGDIGFAAQQSDPELQATGLVQQSECILYWVHRRKNKACVIEP